MSAKSKANALVSENVIRNRKNIKKFLKTTENLLRFSFYYGIIKDI